MISLRIKKIVIILAFLVSFMGFMGIFQQTAYAGYSRALIRVWNPVTHTWTLRNVYVWVNGGGPGCT